MEWIQTSERLPDVGRVLIWVDAAPESDSFAHIAYWQGDGWEVPEYGFINIDSVSHWAYIVGPDEVAPGMVY